MVFLKWTILKSPVLILSKEGVDETIYAFGLEWIKSSFLIHFYLVNFIKNVCISSAEDS